MIQNMGEVNAKKGSIKYIYTSLFTFKIYKDEYAEKDEMGMLRYREVGEWVNAEMGGVLKCNR